MNNNIYNLSTKINENLLNNNLIKDYLNMKNELISNEDFLNLQNEINYYKNCSIESENNYISKEKYKELMNNPFIHNYLNLEEEVLNLLNEVKSNLL